LGDVVERTEEQLGFTQYEQYTVNLFMPDLVLLQSILYCSTSKQNLRPAYAQACAEHANEYVSTNMAGIVSRRRGGVEVLTSLETRRWAETSVVAVACE
jgi:hypothetical protein